MFSMSNGVQLGAVLSPVLFAAYFDKLFERLRASGIGCHKSKLMYFNISHENLSVKSCGKEVLLVSHKLLLVVISLIG